MTTPTPRPKRANVRNLRLRGLAALAASLALAACAGKRKVVAPEEWPEIERTYAGAQSELHARMIDRIVTRMAHRLDNLKPGDPRPTADFLALSGGGDWGAFGAGFLVGWGEVTEPGMRRPDFDIVSGVSTGALIAPFAFAGADEDYLRVERLYRHPEADWARLRDWFVWLPGRLSFMEIPGLERDLQKAIDEDMTRRIAARSAEGRLLVVGATNLDMGRITVLDVGEAAEQAVAAAADGGAAPDLRALLLASSSIPAAFPPVSIGDSLYSDGGVTANILVRAEYADPSTFIHEWRRRFPGRQTPLMRYWVIINNHVDAPPQTVQPNWASVAMSALSASIRSATWFQTRLVAAQMDYMNAMEWGQWELRYTAIPEQWRPGTTEQFNKETMNDLADLGRQMGADPSSWKLLTLPRAPTDN